jgi:UDP-galactopyranose mutase
VWDFVNSFVSFNRYTNAPLANYKTLPKNNLKYITICIIL